MYMLAINYTGIWLVSVGFYTINLTPRLIFMLLVCRVKRSAEPSLVVSMAFPIHQRFPNKAKLASVSMEPSAMKNAKS